MVGLSMFFSIYAMARPVPSISVPVTSDKERPAVAKEGASDVSAEGKAMSPIVVGQPVATDLRLVLRSSVEVNTVKRSGASVVARPLAGDLWQVLVHASAQGLRFATTSDLDHLKLSTNDALAVGLQNATASLLPLASVVHDLSAHQIGILQEEVEETSRVIQAKDWTTLAQRLDGHLLVAVPASDTILYSEENGSQSVRILAKMAREVAARAAHMVSPVLLRWTPSGWQSIAVP